MLLTLISSYTHVDAKTLSTDPLAWSQVAGRPSAPTAAYELRRRYSAQHQLRIREREREEREREREERERRRERETFSIFN